MLAKYRWTVPGIGLALLVLAAPAAFVAAASTPAPPHAPHAPKTPASPAAPSLPRVPMPPPPGMAPVPPDGPELQGRDAEPADPEEVMEWFGDLDEETLAQAGPPMEAHGGPMERISEFDGPMAGGHEIYIRRGGPGAEAMAALKLSDTQKDRMRDIHDRQRRESIRARADLEIAALDLRKLVDNDRPDRAAINAQIDKMAARRADLRKAEVGSMIEAREVLTAQQRQQMKAEHEKMRAGMGQGGGDDVRIKIRDRIRQGGPDREVVRIRRVTPHGDGSQ